MLVGRGALRNPWIFQQAQEMAAGRQVRVVTPRDRGLFLLDYIDLLLHEGLEEAHGFRHSAVKANIHKGLARRPHSSRERWVVNKLRALGSWYTKGNHGGSQLRIAINQAATVSELTDIIKRHFFDGCSGVQQL